LKHWAFEKNITATEMGFVAAKGESRSREQGKSTTFYTRGIKINPKKLMHSRSVSVSQWRKWITLVRGMIL
jgi:hypothetical protein